MFSSKELTKETSYLFTPVFFQHLTVLDCKLHVVIKCLQESLKTCDERHGDVVKRYMALNFISRWLSFVLQFLEKDFPDWCNRGEFLCATHLELVVLRKVCAHAASFNIDNSRLIDSFIEDVKKIIFEPLPKTMLPKNQLKLIINRFASSSNFSELCKNNEQALKHPQSIEITRAVRQIRITLAAMLSITRNTDLKVMSNANGAKIHAITFLTCCYWEQIRRFRHYHNVGNKINESKNVKECKAIFGTLYEKELQLSKFSDKFRNYFFHELVDGLRTSKEFLESHSLDSFAEIKIYFQSADYPEFIENTHKILENLKYFQDFDKHILPSFSSEEGVASLMELIDEERKNTVSPSADCKM